MKMSTGLTPNALSVLALANEYCQAIELAPTTDRDGFIRSMSRLLPRIYIAVSDLPRPDYDTAVEANACVAGHLDEEHYEEIRSAMAALLGPDDTYLEVFEEDMKYSDTPIGASLSEGFADIFQPLYNLIGEARDADTETIPLLLDGLVLSFREYWSQTLCNIMRPLNHLLITDNDDNDA